MVLWPTGLIQGNGIFPVYSYLWNSFSLSILVTHIVTRGGNITIVISEQINVTDTVSKMHFYWGCEMLHFSQTFPYHTASQHFIKAVFQSRSYFKCWCAIVWSWSVLMLLMTFCRIRLVHTRNKGLKYLNGTTQADTRLS